MRILVFVWTLLAVPALCQPPRKVEVFGLGGLFSPGGEEASIDVRSGYNYGGAVMVPFATHFAVDAGVHRGEVDREDPGNLTTLRRTMLLPSVVARSGSSRGYFYFGGGVGVQLNSLTTRLSAIPNVGPAVKPPGYTEVSPGVYESSLSDNAWAVHWRTGVVAAPAKHFLLRFDAFFQHRNFRPNIGLNVGVGVRF